MKKKNGSATLVFFMWIGERFSGSHVALCGQENSSAALVLFHVYKRTLQGPSCCFMWTGQRFSGPRVVLCGQVDGSVGIVLFHVDR
jgi:hypothetical protein